jgi:class 3 adenylate cyclase/FMN phosphatase YigB (HAD superfamily)
MQRSKETLTVLFLDVQGYTKLGDDHHFGLYFDIVLPLMAKQVGLHRPRYVNSWGDAIVAAFKVPVDAARAALDLRDMFRNTNWANLGLSNDLAARIGLHAGSIFIGKDPLQKRTGIAGHNVNLAARIEPVVRTNEVWVSEAAVSLLREEGDSKIAWDDLGEHPLAKVWGSRRLYRLRRHHEPANLDVYDPENNLSPSAASPPSAYAISNRRDAIPLIERIIDGSKETGELCVAGVANTDFFGADSDRLNFRLRTALKNGLTSRFIFLDPNSRDAARRRIFELPRLDSIPVINGSISAARNLRSETKNKVRIRLAQDMPCFLCFNSKEGIYHTYFTSVTGRGTQTWFACGDTLKQLQDHFNNLWGEKWILFDLGNVLVKFDHHRVGRQLFHQLPRSMQDKMRPRDIYNYIFTQQGTNSPISYNTLIDLGQTDLARLRRDFNRHFKANIGEDVFLEAWCSIFDELDDEAMNCVKRVLDLGIKVGICSNTNPDHWNFLCDKHPELKNPMILKFLSFKIGKVKTDPTFFQSIAEITRRPYEEHLLVDDIDLNLATASAIGMQRMKVEGLVRFENIEDFLMENYWV